MAGWGGLGWGGGTNKGDLVVAGIFWGKKKKISHWGREKT